MPPETQTAQAISRYWSTVGSTYDRAAGHGIVDPRERTAWEDALSKLLPPGPSDVLDVGTGTGFLADLLSGLGHRVVGVDLAAGMLEQARAKVAGRTNLPEFRIGDAHDPGVPDHSFDVVVNRHIVWTLEDPARAFRAWYAALRPGGLLLAIDGLWWPGGYKEPEPAPHDEQPADAVEFTDFYTPEMRANLPLMLADSMDPIVALARDAGFADVDLVTLDDVERIEFEITPSLAQYGRKYVLRGIRPMEQ